MNRKIEEQVVNFYDALYRQIFTNPFGKRIPDLRRRKATARQVEEAADASSQALVRLFDNERLAVKEVADILDSFDRLGALIQLADIDNGDIQPDSLMEELLEKIPRPSSLIDSRRLAVFRLALLQVVQVLLLVGPVMAEWGKLNFSSEFGLLTRVIEQLNRISEQLNELGRFGREADDERYELSYRDYLLQRFYRVEAGTVKMTTHLYVDLEKLFVPPKLRQCGMSLEAGEGVQLNYMDLGKARALLENRDTECEAECEAKTTVSFLDHVKQCRRSVIIGTPGSGKSTAFEWLQLQFAAGRDPLGEQGRVSIPLLLRVRQLDPQNLPTGGALVGQALASVDQASVMPHGWLDRQLKSGRILFMLDGLDEASPVLRDEYIIPWLAELITKYPHCAFLVSSRPSGYPSGLLKKFDFTENELVDFEEEQISAYLRNWCTAVHLSQNESLEEAQREGEKDGKRIHDDFNVHPYIRDLARNPLMLSAICLVNYFEGGQLPKDRAKLYKLCVEGLLHNWDQRRGILSEYSFSEKLKACRETAAWMQEHNSAEFPYEEVAGLFGMALGDEERGRRLLEHIRHRAGLLVERRPGVFAFAHLTFQEYLAALGIHEGNQNNLSIDQLISEHEDSRWREVIPLYCGLVPSTEARKTIEALMGLADSRYLSSVLAESYLAAELDLAGNSEFRKRVLERIAVLPCNEMLWKFPLGEVAPLANRMIGRITSSISVSEACFWLQKHPAEINEAELMGRMRQRDELSRMALFEMVYLGHKYGSASLLRFFVENSWIYSAPGPTFYNKFSYTAQVEIAFAGLDKRSEAHNETGYAVLLVVLRILINSDLSDSWIWLNRPMRYANRKHLPTDPGTWGEFASLSRKLAQKLADCFVERPPTSTITSLNQWADFLDAKIKEKGSG